eukprot:s1844_g14.t1
MVKRCCGVIVRIREELLTAFEAWLENQGLKLGPLLARAYTEPEKVVQRLVAYGRELYSAERHSAERPYGHYSETINAHGEASPHQEVGFGFLLAQRRARWVGFPALTPRVSKKDRRLQAQEISRALEHLVARDEDAAKGEQTLLQVSDGQEPVDADATSPHQEPAPCGVVEVEATEDALPGATPCEGHDNLAPTTTAKLVAEVVDATQAAEAAEAEIEAIMREEVLCRALLDPEGEARRRRVQARKSRRKGLRWNFAGRSAKASSDRFREHEVDLESRRKLAFRSRRFRGQAEDQGDERQLGNLAKQREVVLGLAPMPVPASRVQGEQKAQKKCPAQSQGGQASKAQRPRPRGERVLKRRRLPPIDFPELPILIADHEDQDMFPMLAKRRTAPLAIQTQRNCRKARAQELEVMRENLAQELQSVQKERREAARELCQSCVAEAEAVDELQKALTAAFGMAFAFKRRVAFNPGPCFWPWQSTLCLRRMVPRSHSSLCQKLERQNKSNVRILRSAFDQEAE